MNLTSSQQSNTQSTRNLFETVEEITDRVERVVMVTNNNNNNNTTK